mmetsp:Transcript_2764/g.8577  ORF Transcript_2764/g.8577 Transcript_2764/m.8577 type:complete len:308 (-) Transcript_2764:289-1212(-)
MAPDLVRQVAGPLAAVRLAVVAQGVPEPAALQLVPYLPEHPDLLGRQLLPQDVREQRPVVRFLNHHLRVHILGRKKSGQGLCTWPQLPLAGDIEELVQEGYVFRRVLRVLEELRAFRVLPQPFLVGAPYLPLVKEPVVALCRILHINRHAHGLLQALGEDPLRAEGEEDRGVWHETEEEGPCALQGPLHIRSVDGDCPAIHLLVAAEEASLTSALDVALAEDRAGVHQRLTAHRREMALVALPKVRALGPREVPTAGGLGREAGAMAVHHDDLLQRACVLGAQWPMRVGARGQPHDSRSPAQPPTGA